MSLDLNNYYTKGRTTGSKWNFDLEPLMQEFSFYDFCNMAHNGDHGAFLVVTNKQYLIGFNAGFGSGSHMHALGRVHKDLLGGGEIANQGDGIYLSAELQKRALTARITYEPYLDQFERTKYRGRIIIDTDSVYRGSFAITPEQYEQFMKFYKDYNEEIQYVCHRFDMQVEYCEHDTGQYITHTSDSLDDVVIYLQAHLSNDCPIVENEIILNKQNVKKL